MKIKSTIIVLLIGLSLISVACSKSASNTSDSQTAANTSNSKPTANTSDSKAAANTYDDDKFKLYAAANATDDMKLIQQVTASFGLADHDSPAFDKFIKEYREWREKNADWEKQFSTDPQKAREYVKSHMR
jgi:hypothetical protein